ncbi:MAG: hypothetical protein JW994_02840 [Candidatus Omnitrophica bacterium]|nr:hypothetical protein [Candidatus Omnitrophota bacterium]
MITLKKLRKYKTLLYILVMGAAAFWALLSGPIFEAYIDISVFPPQDVRATDFSWITVNEWFSSQAYIITSYTVIKNIKSIINPNKFKGAISAKRIGGADIIRISARSNNSPFELTELVGDIADSYLNLLNKGMIGKKIRRLAKENENDERKLNNLTTSGMRAKIAGNINAITASIEESMLNLEHVKSRLAEIENAETRIRLLDEYIQRLNSELSKLRLVYADGWPEVAKVKQNLIVAEKERNELYASITDEHKYREEKSGIESKIAQYKEMLLNLQNELKEIDKDMALKPASRIATKVKERQPEPQKGNAYGFAINLPAIKVFPEFFDRLFIGVTFGVLLLILIAILYRQLTW